MFDLNNIPKELIEVWAHQMLNQPVGEETYKRFQETINKYPEYFPQQRIYSNIPKEVHQKYQKEELNLYYKFYPRKLNDIQPGKGLWNWVRRQEPIPHKITNLNIQDLAEKVFITAPKIKKEYEKEKRKLWNKHYKKYKLIYGE